MATADSDRERWVRRLRDAAIEAVCSGADERALDAALREGVAEGRRLLALRAPVEQTPTPHRPYPYPRDNVPRETAAPRPAPRPPVHAEPGSALANLLNATRRI